MYNGSSIKICSMYDFLIYCIVSQKIMTELILELIRIELVKRIINFLVDRTQKLTVGYH